MNLVDRQRRALVDIRRLLADFVEDRIEASGFIPKYRSLFAPFDPPDLTTGDLTETERGELSVFLKIMGGWFGEEDALLPRRPNWKYGTDDEPYSWIDGPRYRQWIVDSLAHEGIKLAR